MIEEDQANAPVQFHNVDIEFEIPFDESKLVSWVKTITHNENKAIGFINFIFCDDQHLHEINVTYLNHDTLTDIITFPYNSGETLESDIYISVPRVKENSTIHNSDFKNELLRVMAHGVLHMCGYKDKSNEELKLMRKMEDQCIALYLSS